MMPFPCLSAICHICLHLVILIAMTVIQALSLHTDYWKLSNLPTTRPTQHSNQYFEHITFIMSKLSSKTFNGWNCFQAKFENGYTNIQVMIPTTLPVIFPPSLETSQAAICSVPSSCLFSPMLVCLFALKASFLFLLGLCSKNPTKLPTKLE